jgi:naringenin degradation protein FdeH
MPAQIRRHVITTDEAGKSRVESSGITNEQYQEGFYWRSTLWATSHFPPDNLADKDISADVITREPLPGGLVFRALEIAPDHEDAELHRRVLAELNSAVGQRVQPSDADLARHPNMHRTGTLDFTTCVRGQVYLVTDTDEVLLTPGDTVVLRGGNHAWSNRSGEPCLLVVTMIDANQA